MVQILRMDQFFEIIICKSRCAFIDPEKFDWETTVNIPVDFQTIWHRPPAKGEINYFSKRLLDGSITDEADMKVKMAFWYGVVYPNGKHSLLGDARWQLEKIKYI